MKYIVVIDIDPEVGVELEAEPQKIQEMIDKWQAHNVIGMYFGMTSRRVTVILEAESEDEFFDAIHASWVLTLDYPEVTPVADLDGFPELLARAGVS